MFGKKRLKDMTLTSVDLCKKGANPYSEIKLAKSREKGGENNLTAEQITKAWKESYESIQKDGSLDEGQKAEALEKSLDELKKYIESIIQKSDKPEMDDEDEDGDEDDGIVDEDMDDDEEIEAKKSKKGKEDVNKMITIDIEKMSAEDKILLEKLEKKYSGEQKTEQAAELHPDVKKALDEVSELKKENEAIKKSLEIAELTEFSKKYEVTGKKAPELAEKLYNLKKSGDSTAYNDYVAILDEMAAQSQGVFKEIGSNRQGNVFKSLDEAVAEIQKADPKISRTDAIELAYRNNPDLPETYK